MSDVYTGTHDPAYIFGAAWLLLGIVVCLVGCFIADRRRNRKSSVPAESYGEGVTPAGTADRALTPHRSTP